MEKKIIFGASVVVEFLKNDLSDEFIIIFVPILLGEAILFFKEFHPKK